MTESLLIALMLVIWADLRQRIVRLEEKLFLGRKS